MKKGKSGNLLLLIGLFTASLSVNAGTFIDPPDNKQGRFEIGGEGEFFSQSTNIVQFDNITAGTLVIPVTANSFPIIEDRPPNDWGYSVYLGYIFPSWAHDIQLSYTHLRSDETRSNSAWFNNTELDNFQFPVNAKFNYDFDRGDLTLGSYYPVQNFWILRVGYGLEYAHIFQNVKGVLETTVPIEVENEWKSKSTFSGTGPKLTLSSDYMFMPHFSVVAEAGASVLFGRSQAAITLNNQEYSADVPPCSGNFINHQASLGFETKVGLAFTNNFATGDIQIEGGYKGLGYINALGNNNFDIGMSVVTIFTASGNFDNDYFNYGPYAKVILRV